MSETCKCPRQSAHARAAHQGLGAMLAHEVSGHVTGGVAVAFSAAPRAWISPVPCRAADSGKRRSRHGAPGNGPVQALPKGADATATMAAAAAGRARNRGRAKAGRFLTAAYRGRLSADGRRG